MTDPYDIDIGDIDSRDKLAAFIQLLSTDFVANADAWGNMTVGPFLEAMSAWLGSAGGWADNMAKHRPDLWMNVDEPSWQIFARALRVARTYE